MGYAWGGQTALPRVFSRRARSAVFSVIRGTPSGSAAQRIRPSISGGTDKDGNYLYQNEMTVIDRFRVVCEDPSGALKADSATIKMDPQGGEGWYQGSDSQEVDFELKKQEP